ncbi:MAG: hypothetical protein WEB88_01165 [Gemmatimonadota bacterium]
MPARLLPAALCLVITACGLTDRAARTAGFEVRDSAGIEIVSNAQPEHALAVQEVLRIGVVDGDPDYQFQRIRDMAVDSAGGIWVVDRAESVRRYGPDGRLTTRVGARGSGPGEAPQGWGSVLLGPGELSLHALGGGIQRFLADGTFLNSYPSRTDHGYMSAFGRSGDRWVMRRRVYPDTGTVFRLQEVFLLGPSPAGPFDTLAALPGELSYTVSLGAERGVGRGSYFVGNPTFAVDGRGSLFVSDSTDYRIERYGPDGTLERVLTRAAEPVSYDPGWIDAMPAAYEAYVVHDGRTMSRATAEQVDRMLEVTRAAPVPAHLPFIHQIMAGPGGTVWAQRADRHPDPAAAATAHFVGVIPAVWPPEWRAPHVFDLFDPAGEYQGTVALPAAFTPMAVAGTAIYGVMRDDLDVEYVTVFEVTSEAG